MASQSVATITPLVDWDISSRDRKLGKNPLGAVELPGRGVSTSMELRPAESKLAGMIFLGFFTLVWNAIIGFIVWRFIDGVRGGQPFEWFPVLFLTPFVVIGLLLIAAMVYAILARFNPKPIITLDRVTVVPGEPFQLNWRIEGRAGRLRNVRISIEASESATYRRGTDVRTDTEPFYRNTVVEHNPQSHDPYATSLWSGETTVTIPDGSMHSFSGYNNYIMWRVKFEGDIPRWPDVDEAFELIVTPRGYEPDVYVLHE